MLRFKTKNAPKAFGGPGFARTHWGSLQRSPDLLAGLKRGQGQGKGERGKDRRG